MDLGLKSRLIKEKLKVKKLERKLEKLKRMNEDNIFVKKYWNCFLHDKSERCLECPSFTFFRLVEQRSFVVKGNEEAISNRKAEEKKLEKSFKKLKTVYKLKELKKSLKMVIKKQVFFIET